MIERNPGAVALWVCERGDYQFVWHGDGVLAHLDGDPSALVPWAAGEPGAWGRFQTALEEGLPSLEAMLGPNEEGREMLDICVDRASRLLESHQS